MNDVEILREAVRVLENAAGAISKAEMDKKMAIEGREAQRRNTLAFAADLEKANNELDRLRAENGRLWAFINDPPTHKFWGAGEPDCPKDIKAPNGELWMLRCKNCGVDNPRDNVCRAALAQKEKQDEQD